MGFQRQRTTWCHVVWFTHRSAGRFNIAEEARFCERFLLDQLVDGVRVDSACVIRNAVHALIRLPRARRPEKAAEQLMRSLERALRQRPGVPRWPTRLWRRGVWCRPVREGAALVAVRRYLRARSAWPGHPPPATVNTPEASELR